jgi:hypothetical protein
MYTPDLAVDLEYMCRKAVGSGDGATEQVRSRCTIFYSPNGEAVLKAVNLCCVYPP